MQSEIQFKQNTKEKNQLPTINYLSGDNDHNAILQEQGLCSLEQKEKCVAAIDYP